MSALHSAAFLQAMAEAGLAMHKPALLGDGALHRYRVVTDKAGSTNGWYVLHLDEKPFGAFGSWKTGQSENWTATDYQAMSEAERKALAVRMAAAKLARDAEQAAVHAAAAVRALGLWNRAKPATNDHPYLVRKQVHAFGIRELRGQLLIPVQKCRAGELNSLQFISPWRKTARDKTFLTGGRKIAAVTTPSASQRMRRCALRGLRHRGNAFTKATGHAVRPWPLMP
jgi:putative DNA primase/helicase